MAWLPTSPSEVRVGDDTSAGLRTYGRWRVPCLLASLPSSREPVLLTRSFPITAAGQSRTSTGFPLATPECRRTDAVLSTL